MRLFRLAPPVFAALIIALGWVPARAVSLTFSRPTPSARVLIARAPHAPVTDLGQAAASTPVHLAVVLKYRHIAELHQFVALQGQAQKRLPRILTAQQFLNYFAPTALDYQQTAIALQSAGFTITRTYQNRTVIDATGPAVAAERLFTTEIHMVRQRDGTLRYANLRPAYLPDSLKPTVFGVVGLDNLRLLHTDNVRGNAAHTLVKIGPPMQGPDLGLGPFGISTAYDLPVQHAIPGGKAGQTYDGSGQAAAVVINADFLDSDLKGFLNYFHVVRTGPKTIRILINGGPAPGLTYPDSAETTLDVETIVGNAPGVALYVYEMDSLAFTSTIDAYNQVNSDDQVGVVNSSFGGCEDQTDPSNFPALANHLALQGNALGIVYAASSGDSGSNECGFDFFTPQGVSSPASGPHFVAVGGTTLFPHLDGTYSREVGWFGSGGGVSDIFATPAYQVGVPNMVGKTRNLPDVAFDADPNSGASLYIGGGWFGPIGGTSLASPIFTALVSELDQYGHCRIGNIHSVLYRNYKKYGYHLPAGAPLFHDAIGQNNGFYLTTPGYDRVTGIGSIDGWNFAVTTHL